jgi:hypothetical protein
MYIDLNLQFQGVANLFTYYRPNRHKFVTLIHCCYHRSFMYFDKFRDPARFFIFPHFYVLDVTICVFQKLINKHIIVLPDKTYCSHNFTLNGMILLLLSPRTEYSQIRMKSLIFPESLLKMIRQVSSTC